MTVLFFLFTLTLLPTLAWGADAVANISVTVWTPVIIAVIPIMVMLLKRYIPDSVRPLIPVLLPVISATGDIAYSWATGQAANPAASAGIALVAVGVREAVDGLRRSKLTPDSWAPPTGPPPGAKP
jgi:hypothetical protein